MYPGRETTINIFVGHTLNTDTKIPAGFKPQAHWASAWHGLAGVGPLAGIRSANVLHVRQKPELPHQCRGLVRMSVSFVKG